jgi:flagellar protein FlaJ
MEKKLKTIMAMDGIIVAIILFLDFLFMKQVGELFSTIIIISIIIFLVPIALVRYFESYKVKVLEDYFPQFMHDFVEGIRAGMSLPQALDAIANNDYGKLSYHIKKLNAQLNWGIPFEKVFLKFSRGTKSKLIGRISSTIIESHRFGGNLIEVFEAISSATVEIERLRAERKMFINSQLVTGYIIFFVFLMVIIGLQKFLVPTMTNVSVGDLTPNTLANIKSEYNSMFRNLIIIQGAFAGLVIGKMSEGNVASGIKHSMFMMIAGILVYSLAALI